MSDGIESGLPSVTPQPNSEPLLQQSSTEPEQEVLLPPEGLPPEYTIKQGMVINYEVPDLIDGKMLEKRGVIMDVAPPAITTAQPDGAKPDVAEPVSYTFSLWNIIDNSLVLGSQSSHPIYKPFEAEPELWGLKEIEAATRNFYIKNDVKVLMFANMDPEVRAKFPDPKPEAVQKFIEKNVSSVLRIAGVMFEEGSKSPEKRERTVTDTEILKAWKAELKDRKRRDAINTKH